MEEMEFQARSQCLADGTYVVSVAGELDLYTAPVLEEALELNGDASGRVVVDLSECTFLDSTGLAILVRADRRIGAALLVVACGRQVLRTFEVSGLDRQFVLHPTLESALNGGVSGWRDGEAQTQAAFREVNELIEQLAEGIDVYGFDQLVCECGNQNCGQPIEVTRAEYERVRAYGNRFVVALNHENPETDSIIEQNERFVVVETYAGASSRIARETDPRSQQHIRVLQEVADAEIAESA